MVEIDQQATEFRKLFNIGKVSLSKWGHNTFSSYSTVDVVDFFCCAVIVAGTGTWV